nr:hypothetical protein [Rubripirellula sp.]
MLITQGKSLGVRHPVAFPNFEQSANDLMLHLSRPYRCNDSIVVRIRNELQSGLFNLDNNFSDLLIAICLENGDPPSVFID